MLGILLLPLLGVQTMYQLTWQTVLIHTVISVSLMMLLNAAERIQGWTKYVFKSALISFYFIFLFMLLFEVTLFDFTGRGFTNEVYFHFEVESFRIAFNEYPIQLLAFSLVLVLYTFFINTLLKKSAHHSHPVVLLVALVMMLLVTTNSSMARFYNGFLNYLGEEPTTLDQTLINKYLELGVLSNGTVTSKKNLYVELQADSKNLILLYLESFNEGLLELEQYPGLTPNLNRLTETYNKLNHLSSAYVTIEGVISSQCGTMLPMTAGNNTFLNNGQLMSNMPCLGDVLQKAGYTQYYLGGAAMEFAGKGRFFEKHGYDYIWGSEYWYANGFKKPKGVWGLSDTQLFENALSTIKKAAENPPYNVTFLTLGTHLPGYTYEGCNAYPGSDEPFINAIHCTDQLVGNFVNELEKAQLLDDAVLMIVADHGVFQTEKMNELFGEKVNKRQLIGITNQNSDNLDQPISSYDLVAVLLDMLNIKHNAKFLFGQSLKQKKKGQQKFVTRYLDWQGTEMIGNQLGACNEKPGLTWPLNNCQKQQLLSLTSQLLEHYSIAETPEELSCNLTIKYSKNTKKKIDYWSLFINNINHFEHFYYEGYLLNSLHIKSGSFVFTLNDQLAIEKHVFLKNDENKETHLQRIIDNTLTPLLVLHIHTEEDAESSIEIDFYENGKQLWSEKYPELIVDDINICR